VKRRKRGHHTVEEFGQFGITPQPLENTFAARQLLSGAFASAYALQEETDGTCPGLAAGEKRSTVQGPCHVALEEFAERGQGEAPG